GKQRLAHFIRRRDLGRAERNVITAPERSLAGVDLRAIRRIRAVSAVVILVVMIVVFRIFAGGGVVVVEALDVGVARLVAIGIVGDPADDVAVVVEHDAEQAEDVTAVGIAFGVAVANTQKRIAAAADQVDQL